MFLSHIDLSVPVSFRTSLSEINKHVPGRGLKQSERETTDLKDSRQTFDQPLSLSPEHGGGLRGSQALCLRARTGDIPSCPSAEGTVVGSAAPTTRSVIPFTFSPPAPALPGGTGRLWRAIDACTYLSVSACRGRNGQQPGSNSSLNALNPRSFLELK